MSCLVDTVWMKIAVTTKLTDKQNFQTQELNFEGVQHLDNLHLAHAVVI